MKSRRNRKQFGFGVVGIMILVGVFVVALAVGILAYAATKRPAQTTQTAPKAQTTAVDATAGWLAYDDEYVSFRYPKDWKVTLVAGSAYALNIVGPADKSIKQYYADSSNDTLRLRATLTTRGTNSICSYKCDVGKVETIQFTDGSTRRIVYSDNQGKGFVQGFSVVSAAVKAGEQTYQYGIDGALRIDGTVQKGSSEGVRLDSDTNYSSIDSMMTFKAILRTLTIK